MKKYYQKNKKVLNSAIAENATLKNKKKALRLKPKFGFARAKKALGQNFLKSETALRKIVEAGEIKKSDVILEIGPGKGALTEKLLERMSALSEGSPRSGRSGFVIAVEKDRELFESLKIKFEKEISSGQLKLINYDILDFDLSYELLAKSYKIIANIPYNITGAILKKFLAAKNQPALMVLMVQHEVAKRIMGANPTSPRLRRAKESILSISVKAYGEPKMIMKVEARYFSPSPKVDSAVIAIKNISRKLFTSPQPSPCKGEGGETTVQGKNLNNQTFEEKFWEIVKAGFAHKRKKLSSNLKSLKTSSQEQFLRGLGDKRAEDLTLADWLTLAR